MHTLYQMHISLHAGVANIQKSVVNLGPKFYISNIHHFTDKKGIIQEIKKLTNTTSIVQFIFCIQKNDSFHEPSKQFRTKDKILKLVKQWPYIKRFLHE